MLIGAPEDLSASQTPRIWKYGSLQIAFACDRESARVNFIGLYFRESLFTLPSRVVTDGWWPIVGTLFEEFHKYLVDENISFREHPELTYDDQLTLLVGLGVNVCFSVEEGKRTLDSMQYYAAEKQLTNR